MLKAEFTSTCQRLRVGDYEIDLYFQTVSCIGMRSDKFFPLSLLHGFASEDEWEYIFVSWDEQEYISSSCRIESWLFNFTSIPKQSVVIY